MSRIILTASKFFSVVMITKTQNFSCASYFYRMLIITTRRHKISAHNSDNFPDTAERPL